MSSTETTSRPPPGACAKCGRRLPSGALCGNCPSCLWKLAPLGLEELPALGGGPRRFGSYELIEEIARGGMGVVWRARQDGLGREVALKMILAGQLASSAQVLRFYTEARAAARLDHGNIVPIYEFGEEEGCHFFSMKLIEGRSLADVTREGVGLPDAQLARLLATVSRAIHFAHQRGVLHRDLKPSNILLDASGEPYVADFGLARIAEDETNASRGDVLLGTPAYMAPEQAGGSPRSITTAADVYSLGAILHELLTGSPPFHADTPLQTLRLVVESDLRPPSSVNPKVDRDLEVICLKCLQKQPEKRYGSALELAEDLERWLAGQPIRARPVSLPERLFAWARRKPELATALVALSVILCVAFVVTLLLLLQVRRESDARAVALRSEEGQRLAFQSMAVLGDNPGQALLVALDAVARAPSLSANNALLVSLEACRERRRFLGHASTVYFASFSADGERVVTASQDRTARIWDARTGQSTFVLVGHTDAVRTAVFSPDRERVLTAGVDATARVWSASSGKQLLVLATDGDPVHGAVFSPDGQGILAASEKSARLWRASTGELLQTFPGHASKVACAEFSPGGETILVGSRDGSVTSWDVATRAEANRLLSSGGVVIDVAMSADGRRIAASSGKIAQVWDAASGKELCAMRGHAYEVYSVALTSDGLRLATGSEDFTARIWDASTGEPLHVLRHGHKVTRVRISRDDQWVLTSSFDKFARVWSLRTGALVAEMGGHAGPLCDADFSPNGQDVLTSSVDFTARLWRVQPLQPAPIASDAGARLLGAALSPDGATTVQFHASGTAATVLDLATRREVARLEGHGGRILTAGFDSTGSTILTASEDGDVRLWDARSGKLQRTLKGAGGPLPIATFSPDGLKVATASGEGTVTVWRAADGAETAVLRFLKRPIRTVRFAPDSRQFVVVDDGGTARVGDAESGTERFLPRAQFGVVSCADFGPDGRRLVTTSFTTRAHVRSFPDGKIEATLVHPARVMIAAYSPDKRWIATLAHDGIVRVWDASTYDEWLDIREPGRFSDHFSFSADSSRALVSWSETGSRDDPPVTVLSYPLNPIEEAKEARFGELTPDERDHFKIGSPEERREYRRAWRGGHIFGAVSGADR